MFGSVAEREVGDLWEGLAVRDALVSVLSAAFVPPLIAVFTVLVA